MEMAIGSDVLLKIGQNEPAARLQRCIEDLVTKQG